MQDADLTRLSPTAINSLASDLNGLVVKIMLTVDDGQRRARITFITYPEQFAEASLMVNELFGNHDLVAFYYAIWALFEETVAFETSKLPTGIAKPVHDRHKDAFAKGTEHLASTTMVRFPFKSLKWAKDDDVARA